MTTRSDAPEAQAMSVVYRGGLSTPVEWALRRGSMPAIVGREPSQLGGMQHESMAGGP